MSYSLTGKEMELIKNFKKSHEHICHYCGKEIKNNTDVTVDHLNPVSRGGQTIEENLTISCEHCNKEKSDLTEKEYLTYLENRKELIKNNELILKLDNLINTYQEIINAFIDNNNKLSDLRKEKTMLEKTIRDEIYNASEGYNLCRDLKNILNEIRIYNNKQRNMQPIYSNSTLEKKNIEKKKQELISSLSIDLKVKFETL